MGGSSSSSRSDVDVDADGASRSGESDRGSPGSRDGALPTQPRGSRREEGIDMQVELERCVGGLSSAAPQGRTPDDSVYGDDEEDDDDDEGGGGASLMPINASSLLPLWDDDDGAANYTTTFLGMARPIGDYPDFHSRAFSSPSPPPVPARVDARDPDLSKQILRTACSTVVGSEDIYHVPDWDPSLFIDADADADTDADARKEPFALHAEASSDDVAVRTDAIEENTNTNHVAPVRGVNVPQQPLRPQATNVVRVNFSDVKSSRFVQTNSAGSARETSNRSSSSDQRSSQVSRDLGSPTNSPAPLVPDTFSTSDWVNEVINPAAKSVKSIKSVPLKLLRRSKSGKKALLSKRYSTTLQQITNLSPSISNQLNKQTTGLVSDLNSLVGVSAVASNLFNCRLSAAFFRAGVCHCRRLLRPCSPSLRPPSFFLRACLVPPGTSRRTMTCLKTLLRLCPSCTC